MRCPHLGLGRKSWNKGVPLYTEVSSFQGVGIEESHCIYLSSFQEFHCIQYRGVLISGIEFCTLCTLMVLYLIVALLVCMHMSAYTILFIHSKSPAVACNVISRTC